MTPPRFFTWIALLLTLGLGGLFSWYALYANFQLYDDEGYFLVFVQHVLDGNKPYDGVSTVYGPLYIGYRWLLHGIFGLGCSTDDVRITVWIAWMANAALCGWLVRAGGATPLSAITTAGACLFHLFALTNEPGHPQDLAVFVMLLGVLGWARWRDSRPVLAAAVLGACVAGCALIKVNLGLFIGLPALILLLSGTIWSWGTLVVTVAMPVLLTRAHGSADWRIGLCAASIATSLSLFALPRQVTDDRRPHWAVPHWPVVCGAVLGGLVVSVIAIGFALLLEATPSGLLRALVVIPSRFTSEIVLGIRVPREALYSALAALLLLLVSRRFPRILVPARLAWFALVLWGALAHLEWLIPYALPFGWLGLGSRDNAARTALVALLPLQPLLVFPVSGTQETLATLLLIPLAFWAFEEACASLGERVRQWSPLIPLAACLFVLMDAGNKWQAMYNSRPPMLLPGVERTRATEFITARAQFLADTVRANADRFLSVRGDNSVYSWSGLRPSCGVIISHSWKLFDDAQQQEIADAYRSAPRTLVLDNPSRVPADLRARLPFFEVLASEFTPVARIDFDILCARRDEPRPKLMSACVLSQEEIGKPRPRARIAWPSAQLEGSVGRIQVGDLERGRGLADSDVPDPRFQPRLVRGEDLFDPRAKRFPRLADLQKGDTVWLELPQGAPVDDLAGMRVVFSGPAGRKLLVLPLVIEL